jgi:hypothetical protein
MTYSNDMSIAPQSKVDQALGRRWCMHAEIKGTDASVQLRARLEQTVRRAPSSRAVVVRFDRASVVVTFSSYGDGPGQAHQDGFEFLESVGVPDTAKYTLEQVPVSSIAPPLPDLIGVKEVARLLRVTRQRASEIARAPGRYPKPVTRVEATPLWLLEEVREFASTNGVGAES